MCKMAGRRDEGRGWGVCVWERRKENARSSLKQNQQFYDSYEITGETVFGVLFFGCHFPKILVLRRLGSDEWDDLLSIVYCNHVVIKCQFFSHPHIFVSRRPHHDKLNVKCSMLSPKKRLIPKCVGFRQVGHFGRITSLISIHSRQNAWRHLTNMKHKHNTNQTVRLTWSQGWCHYPILCW